MSIPTRNPLRMIGAISDSGGPNTGDLLFSQGGTRTWSAYSGGFLTLNSGSSPLVAANVTGHGVVFSGAGRLHTVVPHQAISGQTVQIYDSATAASSGIATVPALGAPIIAVIAANSFYGANALGGPTPFVAGMPFNRGLCVNAASGAPGFTVSYTPDILASGVVNA